MSLLDFGLGFFTSVNVMLSLLLTTIWMLIGVLASFNLLLKLFGKASKNLPSVEVDRKKHPYIMRGEELDEGK